MTNFEGTADQLLIEQSLHEFAEFLNKHKRVWLERLPSYSALSGI